MTGHRAILAGVIAIVLGGIVTMMESRIKQLMKDATYHVAWRGNGYVVVRNSDGQVMTGATCSWIVTVV